MLDLLMIGLFQAASGDPQATPPPEARPAEQSQPASAENVEEGDRVVCRRDVQTGTRFTQRRCYRVRDLEDGRSQDQQNLRRQQIVNTPGKR
jgi:hypothetical protein